MNKNIKNYIERMLKKVDWSDESNDKPNLYYLTCILQTVIDMNEQDREYFDEHYAFTANFNMHGYGCYNNKLSFSSNGIKIWNTDELKVRGIIDMFLNEGITDKEELIDAVADDLASDYSYKNDFDRYQGVDRNDNIYDSYFEHFKHIATKILKEKG